VAERRARMPLPDEHLDWLREHIADHERRLAQLREGIRLAEEEAGFHEVLLDLARNDQLIEAAVRELYDDTDVTSPFARDPIGYCREQGIPLPEGVTLRVSAVDREEGRSARLTVDVRYGPWAGEIFWDPVDGFNARPSTGPAEVLSTRFMNNIEVASA
jgi:hypothetical protein